MVPVQSERWDATALEVQQSAHKEGIFLAVAYVAMCFLTVFLITFMYWSRGTSVIFRILVYLYSLSTVKLAVKFVFEDYKFNYPKFVTGLHFIFCSFVAACVLASQSRAEGQTRIAKLERGVPTRREFCLQVMPIALAFAYSVGANNMALVFCSAAFTEIVGATSPVVSALFSVMMGLPFDLQLLGPTLLVVFACAVSTSGEVNFSVIGFFLCLMSMLSRALKATVQQYTMTGESRQKFDPVNLMLWTCLPSFALVQLWSFATEGLGPFRDLMKLSSAQRFGLAFCIFLSCANACVLNLAALFCTRDLGAVGVQIVAQVKSILTFLGAVALFGDVVTTREVVGFVAVLIGVFWFSHKESKIKKEKEELEPKRGGDEPKPLAASGRQGAKWRAESTAEAESVAQKA